MITVVLYNCFKTYCKLQNVKYFFFCKKKRSGQKDSPVTKHGDRKEGRLA